MDEEKDYSYDENEMRIRDFAFELAKIESQMKSFMVSIEWEKLQKEQGDGFKEKYPAITSLIEGNVELTNPNSPARKLIFDNPLMKLAVISQKPKTDEESKNEL